jgi:hypothetical protein
MKTTISHIDLKTLKVIHYRPVILTKRIKFEIFLLYAVYKRWNKVCEHFIFHLAEFMKQKKFIKQCEEKSKSMDTFLEQISKGLISTLSKAILTLRRKLSESKSEQEDDAIVKSITQIHRIFAQIRRIEPKADEKGAYLLGQFSVFVAKEKPELAVAVKALCEEFLAKDIK